MRVQLCLLLCSLIFLAACSAGGNAQHGSGATGIGASAELDAAEMDWAGLPGLDELPLPSRRASNTPADCIRTGAQIVNPDARENAIVFGDGLVMAPDWDPGAVPPKLDVSWGIYGFHIPGYSRSGEVDINWNSAPDAANTYVAISDYSTGRWRWQKGNPDNSYDFGAIGDYFSGSDIVYCAVLLTGSGSFELQRLRLGGNFAPTPVIMQDLTVGKAPQRVFFDATGSSDVDGSIDHYEWSFENPLFFQEKNGAANTYWDYDYVGFFTVTLRVVDDEGGSAETTSTVSITGEPDNMAPTAVLSASSSGGPLPQLISFDAILSTDPDDIVSSYRWDMDGDGYHELKTSIPVANAEFIEAGSFEVGLMVIDFFGEVGTDSKIITITPVSGTSPPVASLSTDYWCTSISEIRAIYADGSSDPDNDIVKYEWDTDGDGSYDFDSGLSSFYVGSFGPGIYTIGLRISDSGGRSDTDSINFIATDGAGSLESEPNDAPGSADSLGELMRRSKYVTDWKANCGGSDGEDWYLIEADRAGELSISVDFISLFVDLALAFYSADDLVTPLAEVDGVFDQEYLHVAVPSAGDYYIRVFVPSGASASGPGEYTMKVLENHLPVAQLTGAPLSGVVPFGISVDASGSTDADDDIYYFDYDFNGDGFYEVVFEGSTYLGTITELGVHNIAVQVYDIHGESSIAYLEVEGLP